MFIAEQQYRDASTRALGVLEHHVETEAIRAYRPTTGGAPDAITAGCRSNVTGSR